MGGAMKSPTYEDVCSDETGHTEVVQVEYDPTQLSYEKLLQVFWKTHNPCRSSKAQYRSVIFTHTPEQAKTARAAKEKLSQTRGNVVTAIVPAGTFWRAEEYHQQYYEKNGFGKGLPGVGSL
jgi:peptide-methionine (S)-S-oxide reductase